MCVCLYVCLRECVCVLESVSGCFIEEQPMASVWARCVRPQRSREGSDGKHSVTYLTFGALLFCALHFKVHTHTNTYSCRVQTPVHVCSVFLVKCSYAVTSFLSLWLSVFSVACLSLVSWGKRISMRPHKPVSAIVHTSVWRLCQSCQRKVSSSLSMLEDDGAIK